MSERSAPRCSSTRFVSSTFSCSSFAATLIDLARLSFAQDELDPGAVVLCVEPVAHLPAVTVERQRLAVERIRGEERQNLFRILVRPIRVRAACGRRVDAERPYRGEHLEVAACFRRAVRARRPQRIVLARRPTGLDVAVDLVRRDLDEPGGQRPRDLQQHEGAENVGADEVFRAWIERSTCVSAAKLTIASTAPTCSPANRHANERHVMGWYALRCMRMDDLVIKHFPVPGFRWLFAGSSPAAARSFTVMSGSFFSARSDWRAEAELLELLPGGVLRTYWVRAVPFFDAGRYLGAATYTTVVAERLSV
jgi:hypothetical protein